MAIAVRRVLADAPKAEERPVEDAAALSRVKRMGTGLCFIVFPLIWVLAFAAHPHLLAPRLALGPQELIQRAHGNGLLQFAHALVTVNTALLVVIAVDFMKRLAGTRAAWAGLVGAACAIVGACLLAADKGALCLTMSALDTIPWDSQMAPRSSTSWPRSAWPARWSPTARGS